MLALLAMKQLMLRTWWLKEGVQQAVLRQYVCTCPEFVPSSQILPDCFGIKAWKEKSNTGSSTATAATLLRLLQLGSATPCRDFFQVKARADSTQRRCYSTTGRGEPTLPDTAKHHGTQRLGRRQRSACQKVQTPCKRTGQH